MKMQTMSAITVGLTILLCACTTTKDLERHPEMVAVESPRNQMKEGAAGKKGMGNKGKIELGLLTPVSIRNQELRSVIKMGQKKAAPIQRLLDRQRRKTNR